MPNFRVPQQRQNPAPARLSERATLKSTHTFPRRPENIEHFTVALLMVGLLLALCFGIQGMGVLMTAKWIEQLKTTGTA